MLVIDGHHTIYQHFMILLSSYNHHNIQYQHTIYHHCMTLSQDNRLNLLAEQNNRNGLTDWTKVATELGYGMNSIQCRRRWEKMSKQRIRDLTAAFMGDNRSEMVSHPMVVDSALLCIHAVTEPELKHIEDAFNSLKSMRRMSEIVKTKWTPAMVIDEWPSDTYMCVCSVCTVWTCSVDDVKMMLIIYKDARLMMLR